MPATSWAPSRLGKGTPEKPYLQRAGGWLQLQVTLAGGVPAAEGEVAGQVLGPHGLSIECHHLGLKKRGYLVKAWVPGKRVFGVLLPALPCR